MGVQHAHSIIPIFLSYLILSATSQIIRKGEDINNRPIIGILSQEIGYKLNSVYPGKYDSYIAASYVKFIEGAGARVVPIWIGQSEEYYRNLVHNVNGILWPGGSTWFNQTQGYADAGNIIYRLATEINENGGYFPILGICLGFELMTYVAANRNEHRTQCLAEGIALPLTFNPDIQSSRMFKNAQSEIIDILRYKNVTANFHQFCVTRKGLENAGLTDTFLVTSTSEDKQGMSFVSTLEHKTYPFYGLQFHPEKNLYEWVTGRNIPHGDKACQAAQYFANFFVNEARKNLNKFLSDDEEARSLIYNYHPTYTGQLGSVFEQTYLFNADVRRKKNKMNI